VGAITYLDIGAAEFQSFSDSDNDGVGDAFDICPGFDDNVDTDNDSVPDGCDACAGFDDNMDADSDGVPDGCDVCAGFDDIEDADGDGTPDGCDVCPGFNDYNDMDNDGVPDACDADCTTFPVHVATSQELSDAIDCANYLPDSGTIYLDADITLTSELDVSSPIVIEGQGHVIERDSGANLNQLIFVSTIGELTLRELTLRNGASGHGGAVRVTSGTLTMIDCQVTDSSGHFGAGAILAQNNSDVTLERVVMTGNVTDSGNGGALEMVGGTLAIRDSVFAGNTARSGSAIYIDGVNQALVANSIFSGNYADGNGGAVWNKNGTLTLVNCTLVNNRGLTNGCGLFTTASATSNLINCIVGGATTDSGPSSEIYTDIGGVFNTSFTALKGGFASVAGSYNDLGGNLSFTNLSDVFVNPIDGANAPTTDGDYHIVPNSVVIDQGDNTEATNAGLTTDIDGDDRIIGLTVDMGADEATCSLDGDDDGDGVCNSVDVCPGFDDKADVDGDGTPDACDFCPDSPNVYNVTQDVYYSTIQAALDAAQNDDLIQLGACTFEESGLTFPFGVKLTLQGAGAGETTFNCVGAGPAINLFGSTPLNSPVIRDLTITGGTSGLAISLGEGDAPTLQSVVVRQWGGVGVIAGGANVVLDRCFFVDNATDIGIAVGPSSIIRQCVIVNTGSEFSVYCPSGSTQIVNSTINSAAGVIVSGSAELDLINSIVKAPLSVESMGTLNASRSMFVGATGDNIDADPVLSDSHRLVAGSPAIDAADYDAYIAAGGAVTDVEDQPRTHDDDGVADTGVGAITYLDIGAFEFQGLTDSDNDGVGDAIDACPGFDDALDADNDGIPDGCDEDCTNAPIHVTTAQELIDAIHCANYSPNISTIFIDADIGLTSAYDNLLDDGLPSVTTPIVIEGQGHVIQRGAGAVGVFRHFGVDGGDLTLRELTLRDGAASRAGSLRVYSGTLSMIDCHVMDNRGHFRSGALYAIGGSDVTLERVTMTGNRTDNAYGGAVDMWGGTLVIRDSIFAGNTADSGSAISVTDMAQAFVTNTIFSSNFAENIGGAIYNSNSTLMLVNCTIAGNRRDAGRSGLYTATGSTTTLINSLVWGNSSASGPQIYTEAGGTMNLSFNGLEGGLAAVEGPLNDNGGNQSFTNADVVFVNPIDAANAPTSIGDYHLTTSSVAINLGDNAAATNAGLTFDIDGDARIIGGVVDLGADEVDACVGDGDSDGDGVCDAVDACPGFDDNVDHDNDGVPDGCDVCDFIDDNQKVHNETQDTYYTTLQSAIDAANNGDVLQLAECVFFEDNITFTPGVDVTIRGGSDRIIDGGDDDNDPIFVIDGGAFEARPVIEGMTIRNVGGPAITVADGNSPTLRRLTFPQVEADHVIAAGGSTLIDSCLFGQCTATDAIVRLSEQATMLQCLTYANTTPHEVRAEAGSPRVVNCTISGPNDSIHAADGVTVDAVNSIFEGGVSTSGSGAINAFRCLYQGATGDNIDGLPTYQQPGNPYLFAQGSLGIDAADYDAYVAAGGALQDVGHQPRTHDDLGTLDTGSGAISYLDIGAIEYQGLTDSDDDGVGDAIDACPGFDDNEDADNDGLPNGCDACPNQATGDVNDDGFVDAGDIAGFAAILLDPDAATPDELCAADTNGDAAVNGLDIQGFVELMIAP